MHRVGQFITFIYLRKTEGLALRHFTLLGAIAILVCQPLVVAQDTIPKAVIVIDTNASDGRVTKLYKAGEIVQGLRQGSGQNSVYSFAEDKSNFSIPLDSVRIPIQISNTSEDIWHIKVSDSGTGKYVDITTMDDYSLKQTVIAGPGETRTILLAKAGRYTVAYHRKGSWRFTEAFNVPNSTRLSPQGITIPPGLDSREPPIE